jgi:hypothetical protein
MLKKCEGCGIEFTPLGARSKCCSVRCRLAVGATRNSETGCLEWSGAIGSHGYGVLNVGGEILTVHRLAYELANGAVAPDSFVCHRCDNRRCIEPDHLFAGTPADNAQDMTAKGKHWIKGKPLPEEYRARLRVPKRSISTTPEERAAARRKAWDTRRKRLAKQMKGE